ncbi:MarR family winged helix-turn-helix transcriptional regulator [Bryobacter aggregatus]|uniref:MarR family winged helix-turn-helix transcriptional regulator n=1 Tax=Bryobacter aggregatus TaxID=360054 RepID=UPI00068ACE5B|nr:MarR family transcriptional regulator [Bryobacter aggregatus]
MVAKSDVETVLECYVRIYFACHTRQVGDGKSKKGIDISTHQAKVLEYLDANDGMTVLDLARNIGVAPSTMSLTLDRLERGSFVRRQKDPSDGRRTLIYLTSDGDRIKRKQKVLEPDLIAAMLGKLPTAKRKEAMAGLRSLMDAATELVGSEMFRELVRR